MKPESGFRSSQFSLAVFALLLGLGPLALRLSAQTYLYNQAGLGVGSKPSGIVVADINGDGMLDVAVANESDGTVSVVLSKTNGSFASKVDYGVGTAPVSLVSGDFNGDRIPDSVEILMAIASRIWRSSTARTTLYRFCLEPGMEHSMAK